MELWVRFCFLGWVGAAVPIAARLVYTLDHTDSGNPGSLLKKLCWMYIISNVQISIKTRLFQGPKLP